jgi:hypothetical protein
VVRVASIVGLSVVLCGCKQLLGIDEASQAAGDAPIVTPDIAIDQPVVDMPEGGVPVIVTFRNGDSGGAYQGTLDTIVESIAPNANNSGDAQLNLRKTDRSVLLQFTQIFGAGANRIPNGATIMNATLDLSVQQLATTGTIYELGVAWTEDVTFNTLGPDPGIAGDFGAAAAVFAPAMIGVATFDVTATVAKWSAGTLANNGWIIVGENDGSDTKLRSSEDSTAANRPTLHVTYLGQ